MDLHRASRYLDQGVPDAERALQMRGTSLLGTTKSGALVEVVARAGWIDERMADARTLARHAIADAVGRWSARSSAIVTAIVIGDRAGLDDDVERRLQEAGTYHVIAISGGNIAILAGADSSPGSELAGPARANRNAGVDRPAGRLRAPGRWWRIGRSRDVHGGRVSRRQSRATNVVRR